MSKTVRIGAIQMDITPTSKTDRLERAENLINKATHDGAQLIVLPELFNVGYTYEAINYTLGEPMDGPTVNWMKAQAATHNIHLAGALLITDGEAVFNTALLIAPDGRTWRYDKRYPAGWEAAFFEGRENMTIAETDLGTFGMLICWDAAHRQLWQQYAGQVDAMIIPSCPPLLNQMQLAYPDGKTIDAKHMGPLMRAAATEDGYFADTDIERQTAWLGVPMVHTSGSGHFRSVMPMAHLSVGILTLLRPDLWRRIGQAEDVELCADMSLQTKIVNADGSVQARVQQQGDAYVISEITLAAQKPQPTTSQPEMSTPSMTYLSYDYLCRPLAALAYRRWKKQQHRAQANHEDTISEEYA